MSDITKKCPNCGATIDFDSSLETAICCYCDSKVYVKQTPPGSDTFSPVFAVSSHKKRMSGLAKVLLIIFASIGFLGIAIFIIGIIIEENKYNDFDPVHGIVVPGINTRDPDKEIQTFSPGDLFVFDDFEIVIGDNYEWRVVEYRDGESPLHGLDALRVPVTITNIGDETNRFDYLSIYVYCPHDVSIRNSTVTSLFRDDNNIATIESMRSGATVSDKYIHFLYDVDGYYLISFETWNKAWEVRIYIEK